VINKIGGAIKSMRAIDHPTSLRPDPVFFSRVSAAERYVGIDGVLFVNFICLASVRVRA
jgi:hypothetical protein